MWKRRSFDVERGETKSLVEQRWIGETRREKQKYVKRKIVCYLLSLTTTPVHPHLVFPLSRFGAPQASITYSKGLQTFCRWPSRCLTRKDWHIQLWPVDQSGYVHLANKKCVGQCYPFDYSSIKWRKNFTW